MTDLPGAGRLRVTLQLSASSIVKGEVFKSIVVFENLTSAPLTLVNPKAANPGPLLYEFENPDTSSSVTLSRQAFDNALMGDDPLEPEEPEYVELAAGDSISVEEDPGEYAAGGLDLGTHIVRARWIQPGLEVQSDPVSLRVEAVQTTLVSTVMCRESSSTAAILDHQVDGGTVLFERAIQDERPDLAALSRIHFVGAPAKVTDLCVAVHAATAIQGRWHAWLQGQQVFAARSWGDTLMAKPPPSATDLLDPTLAQPMFHWANGTGSLVITGQDAQGQRVLQRWNVNERGIYPGPRIAVGACAPFEPPPLRAQADPQSGSIALVWAAREGVLSRLHACILDAQGNLQAAPRLLTEYDLPVLTHAIANLGAPTTALSVHLVLGPDADKQLQLARVSVAAGSSTEPMRPPKWPGEAWAVSAPSGHGATERPIVLARSGTRVMAMRLGDRWVVIRNREHLVASHLHVLTAPERAWAGWYEAGQGMQYFAF